MIIIKSLTNAHADVRQPTTANAINDLDCATAERKDKAFSSLRSAFALLGYALYRTDPADGPVTILAESFGLTRALPTIEDARRFLAQQQGVSN
jgi:hypothetical protein